MDRIRLPLAALALLLLAACQSGAPTAPAAPERPGAAIVAVGDSVFTGVARGGNMFGSGT
ncbi:MAG: hypothetical protein ABW277_27495 [Longimicrobiaceae bacterium]